MRESILLFNHFLQFIYHSFLPKFHREPTNPQESAIKAMNLLAKNEQFQKLEYGDFKNYRMKNRPESYIVNARKEWNGQKWEIETWFVTELAGQVDTLEKLQNLNEDDRKAILKRKKQRSLLANARKHLPSWEIYQDFIK